MSFTKFASLEVLEVKSSPARVRTASLSKFADFSEYRTDDGYMYVRVRAISSRVNKNHDGWPSSELSKAYRTFIGKPIFVDHHNHDPKRARGVIVDAALHVEDEKTSSLDPYYATAPPEHLPPTWIELLLEVDARSFPKLAEAIINDDIDSVSMGANVEMSKCSHCGNEAHTPEEFCKHIQSKGAYFDYVDPRTGEKTSKRSFENCHRLGFFEISFVFDPADETALKMGDPVYAKRAARIAAIRNEGMDKESEYKYVKRRGDKWVIVQKGTGKVLSEHDSEEEAKSAFRAMEMHMHGSVDPLNGFGDWELKTADLQGQPQPNGRNEEPQADMTTAPQKVNTLRQEQVCPVCGSDGMEDGVCEVCFTPDTLVRLREGYAPIGEVEVGDEVLSEDGRFHRVLEVMETPYNGLLFEITTHANIEPIRVTPQHPFKALIGNHTGQKTIPCRPGRCMRNGSLEGFDKWGNKTVSHTVDWVEANQLTENSFVALNSPRETVDLNRISVPDVHLGKRNRRGPNEFELTPDFLWMVGMYLAEGSAGTRSINFALHQDEVEFQERLREFFDSHGYSTRLESKKGSRGVWLTVNSSTLSEWFPAWLGSGCANKRIPAELINLPLEKLDHVIQGVCDGDEGKTHQRLFSQTSPTLAMQVAEHSLRHGNAPTVYWRKAPDKKPVYIVDGSAVATAAKPKTKLKRWTWRVGEQMLVKVKSIKQVPYWGSVYNLRVEGDPTYTVHNILVHNCNYSEPPEGFDNPDLNKAKEVDQDMHQQDVQQAAQGADIPQADVMSPPPPGPQPMPSGAMPATSKITASEAVKSEKTAATSGGRINTQERPILPATRQLSDKPIRQKTVSEAKKPVESNQNKDNMTDTIKTADGATPQGEGVQADKRVDVEGVGAVSGDPLSGIEHENVEKNTGDFTGPHTDTWSGGEGDSLGQHDPVTSETGDLFTVSHDKTADSSGNLGGPIGEAVGDGGNAKDGGPTWDTSDAGFPDHQPARVDLNAPLKEEVGEGTKTFPKDDMHVGDPVTKDNANDLGGPIGVAVASAKARMLKALKVAENEIALGLRDASSKFERVAELEDASEETLDATLSTLASVKTAGLKKSAASSQRTAGATRMPSFKQVTGGFEIEAHAVEDDEFGLF